MYYKTILFDQLTPITIFRKLQNFFKDELSFLFESAINSEEGNYSFLFIGAREQIIHKNMKSFYIDENEVEKKVDDNPFDFLKKDIKILMSIYTKRYRMI